MRNACILKTYARWADNARELDRQRSVLEWMALRIRKARMFKAWFSWRKYASSRQRKRRLLLKASKCADLNTAVFLDLVLDMHMSEIAGNEQYFKDFIVRDVADSIGGHADLIKCVALEAGSIIVHLKLEEGVCGLKRRALDVAKELMAQAAVPNSKLKGGHYTCTAKDVRVVSSSAAVQRNVLFRIVKLRVLHSWRTYVDHESRDRIFIQQKKARALFKLSNSAFASWRTVQKEGRIQQLLLQIESIQLLHDRTSYALNENVTKMCDSIESRLHALLQNQEQVLLGAVSLKQRCEIQHGEIARVLEEMSRVESERRVAVAELESARNERQGDMERIESELRSEMTLLVAEFCDEKQRLREHRQKNTRLVAEIQQRSKRRHRMQQIVSNWQYWASYRQARALGHERVCARFQRQQAKGQKQRILDALSLGKISRLEMELDDVKSSFLCVQTRISSLKAQVSIKQVEPDGESNPERLRFEHEKIDLRGDVTEDGTLETLASDSQHNLEEITLYLSHLRSLNTSLQDRINQQNFKLIEMHQKVQEASTLQEVHIFNENVTKMCDSIESRLHALLQNQEQVLLGAVSLKQRCEIQHGEIARVLEEMSRVESERRVAVAELESARNERQGDMERIESELRSEMTLLVAEFCDEKQRLKQHRIDVFEARKGRERFLCMQEQAFSCLSYYTRQQSKLFRFEGWRRLRCLAQALHTFAFLSKQRHQEEMLEQRDSVVDVIRDAVNEASRMGRNLLEDRPQDSDTPRRKYQEIVPLPPREGRGLHLSGRRFFVREVEQNRTEEPRPYHDVVNSARNLSLMILEVSERNRARMESSRSQDTAYTVLRQKNTRLVAEIQQRSKRRHRMQQIVSNWQYWASYRQARALGHERVCARFQRQQAKGQKQRILDALSLGKISRLEMELDDVKSSFLCVQTRISSLKAQVSIKQVEPDGESNPERLRFEHEKIDLRGDVTEDGTLETLASDSQHNLEEITLYLSHLRSLNTSLQDRINQQNFKLIEMHQKVQEASTLQEVHIFNENVTKMCDSIESRLHALLQNQEQVLLGAVSLKQRCEIQHGEIARVLEEMSRVESERRVAVAELESARNERQGDMERIESELRSEMSLLVAEFCDEKQRLKQHRIDVFEARKGRERFLCMQEQAFSCLSYYTRQQSKLFRFEGWRRLRCLAQALHTFAFLSKQRHQEEMLEQRDSVVDVIRDAVNEASRMGRNLLEDRPQDSDTPRRKYQEIVPLPPREGRGLHLSGRRFFVREVEQNRTEEPRPYHDVVNSARNLSLMILEVSERNRARMESSRSQDTAYTVLRQKNTRLVAEIQQRSKRRHRMQQIVSNWQYWASYRQARALGHERVCARFQRQQAKDQETRGWQAFAEFFFHAKLQRADDVLVELRQQKQVLLTAHDKHVVELQARDTRILILEETALSQAKLIEDVRRNARDVGTAHDKDVIELQECKEVSTRQTHLIADLQRQIEDAQDFDESQSQSIQNLEQVSASLAQVIEISNRQFQDAQEVRGKEHDELQDKLEGTSRELQHALSANANLRGIEVKLKAENSALKNECTRLRSYENSIATIRIRVDDLQTREDDACKQILSMQTTQRALEGKLAASQKSLLQAQQMLQQSEDAAGTIAAEKIELEFVVKTLTASLLAFQSKCHESMEKLRSHNADLNEKQVATKLLAQTLLCDLDAVRMDLYHFTTYETDAAKLEEGNNDLRSSIDAMNGTLKDLNIATIDKALRRSLEQFLSVRGRVMTLEAEQQTLKRECIRLRSTESSLSTFRSRVTEMQSREEAGQRTLLSLQAEKRNAERRLAEANESIRKSDNMLKHLTQDKVDLESELEALKIVNANLRHEIVRNKLLHTEEHFSTLQSPHENVIETKSTLPNDADQLDKLSQALPITEIEKSTLPDDEITHDEAGDEVVDEALFPYSRQSEIDRGKMLIAVGELRNALSARATRSRPCTLRLRPASLEAAPEAEGARVAGQEDVEKDKKRAIQAATKLRASLSSK
jgi:predicted  nucleic acid-binding Zn-ribbon protein